MSENTVISLDDALEADKVQADRTNPSMYSNISNANYSRLSSLHSKYHCYYQIYLKLQTQMEVIATQKVVGLTTNYNQHRSKFIFDKILVDDEPSGKDQLNNSNSLILSKWNDEQESSSNTSSIYQTKVSSVELRSNISTDNWHLTRCVISIEVTECQTKRSVDIDWSVSILACINRYFISIPFESKRNLDEIPYIFGSVTVIPIENTPNRNENGCYTF